MSKPTDRMQIIDSLLSRRLYDYFVYIYRYKTNKSKPLKKVHLNELANALGVTRKQLIYILSVCDWCTIDKHNGLFTTTYTIYITPYTN